MRPRICRVSSSDEISPPRTARAASVSVPKLGSKAGDPDTLCPKDLEGMMSGAPAAALRNDLRLTVGNIELLLVKSILHNSSSLFFSTHLRWQRSLKDKPETG
jgi:hypothetical protein